MTETATAELFAFEVPTSRGHFRIIGPNELPPDEARRVAEKIARLLPLLVLDASPDWCPEWCENHDGDNHRFDMGRYAEAHPDEMAELQAPRPTGGPTP